MTTPPAGGKHVGPHKAQATGTQPDQHLARRTRVGGVWVASALFALVLLLLLIFILENGQKVDIGYFGAHGHLPLGVALLLAAVLGVLLVVIPGAGRILQLRIVARRYRKIGARRATGTPAVPGDSPAAPGPPAAPGSAAAPGEAGTTSPAPADRGTTETARTADVMPGDQARP